LPQFVLVDVDVGNSVQESKEDNNVGIFQLPP
jgi:hypothetical protein